MENLLLTFLKPTKVNSTIHDLGPFVFTVANITVKRTDQTIEEVPFSVYTVSTARPTIVYVHSYNSNRLEVSSILKTLLIQNINVVSIQLQRVKFNESTGNMDINQDEGVISFGYYESQQIKIVINWLKKQYQGNIYIWGRSMGAVSALLYQNQYKDADGLILDSPFHSLYDLLISQFSNITNLPKCIGQSVLFICKGILNKYLRYNFQEMEISSKIQIKCPVFLVMNPKDNLAGQSGNYIYNKCRGLDLTFRISLTSYNCGNHFVNRSDIKKTKFLYSQAELEKLNDCNQRSELNESQKKQIRFSQINSMPTFIKARKRYFDLKQRRKNYFEIF